MGRGKKAKRKAQQIAKRSKSRNAKRREEYFKRSLDEQRSPGVARKEEPKPRIIEEIQGRYAGEVFDEPKKRLTIEDSYEVSHPWSGRGDRTASQKRSDLEFALKSSKQVVFEKVYKSNFVGAIYQWRLGYEGKVHCKNYVYFIEGTSGGQFVCQRGTISHTFGHKNYSEEERDEVLYKEGKKQAKKLADKFKKKFVDKTGGSE